MGSSVIRSGRSEGSLLSYFYRFRCNYPLITYPNSHCSLFRIIYEPWVFFEAYKAYQEGQLSWNKYCNLIKSIMYSFMSVRYSRKPQENNATLVLVLPVYCTPMNVVEVIKKMCPQVKHVFSTRHPLASIRAISQVGWKV